LSGHISDLTPAPSLNGAELLEVSKLSPTVVISGTTISALASDNSYNDSANGFVTAGFAVNNRVRVQGFTGNVANNIFVGIITALTAGKMTIGGTDGDGIVDDAAGETVTITKWVSYRTTLAELASGVQSMPVPASAMVSRTTNGPSTGSSESATNKIMRTTLDFDASTNEFAQFLFPMPKSWNEGTVTAQFIWEAGGTGNVVWGIQGVALSDDDVIDAAFGTAQTVTDGVTATTDVMQSAFTSAITIGGTPAEGDLVCFQVYRDAASGSDTLASDAKLIAIRLNFTTNARDDS